LIGAFLPGKEGFNADKAGANLALALEVFRARIADIETLSENLVWRHDRGTREKVSDCPNDRFRQV
jgi:hypothetical protein